MTTGIDVLMAGAKVISLLTKEEELALAVLLRSPDAGVSKRARNDLVAANIRFVSHMAHGYAASSKTISVDDYISVGLEAMVKNASKFDPVGLGGNFCTFIKPWIRKAFQEIHYTDSVIAVPRYRQISINKVTKAMQDLVTTHGPFEEITNMMVSEVTGIPVAEIENLLAVNRDYLTFSRSLDAPLSSEEGSATLSDIVTNEDLDDSYGQLSDEMTEGLTSLSPEETRVILLLAGLDGEIESSISEIAQIMNITKSKVSALKQSAQNKMILALKR